VRASSRRVSLEALWGNEGAWFPRAFVLAIEAARLLCSGGETANIAARLMRHAIEEIRVRGKPEVKK
jgi:hypothetical protein